MKKTILLVLGVLALGACTDKKTFTVEGTIEGGDGHTLCLYNKSLGGAVLIDSVRLDKSGAFRFKGDAPEAPDFYLLQMGNQVINFSIDSTESVTVSAR